MPTYHRSQRLRLVGTGPKVEQLQEGRFRLTFTCSSTNPSEAWMQGNKSQIFAAYGTLESAEMSIAGIAPRTSEAYSDMVLFRTEANPSERDLIVTLIYETATTSFVKSQDDKIDFELNGLQRVTRVTIAKTGTSLPSVTIGTTSITVNSTACKLASRSVEENDAFIQITETYLQEGTVSKTQDNVGSQLAQVITTFGSDPADIAGYSIASKEESNFSGYQTNTFRFLKNNVELSRSNDNVGSQEAIVRTFFNPTSDPTESGYSLAKKDQSDFEGIETVQYTFLRRDSLMSSSEDNVGSQKAIVEQWFDPTDQYIDAYVVEGSDPVIYDDDTGISGTYYLLDTQASGKVRYSRSTPSTYEFIIFWNASESRWRWEIFQTLVAVSTVSSTHPPTDPSSWTIQASGFSLKHITRENVSPMPIQSSELANFDGSILFDADIRKTKSGYSVAKEDNSNLGGIPTERYTFLKDNVTLSTTEDKVGSQLAIVKEVFNGTPSTPTDYSIAKEDVSSVDGIPTKRFTFLKPSILSVSQDFTLDVNQITVQAFSRTEAQVKTALSEVTSDHKLIRQSEQNHDGITTTSYVFEINTSDIINFTADDRLQVTRTIYEVFNYDYDANYTVNSSTATVNSTSVTLTSLRVDQRGTSGTFTKLTAVYTQPKIISASPVARNQYNLTPLYQYRSLSATPKTIDTTAPLATPNGGTIGVNAVFLEPDVSNTSSPPVITQNVLDTSVDLSVSGSSALISSNQDLYNFLYPGVANLDSRFFGPFVGSDGDSTPRFNRIEIKTTKESHPITTKVRCQVYNFIQRSDQIADTDFTYDGAVGLWSPNAWATVDANIIKNYFGFGQEPSQLSNVYTGYRLNGSSLRGTLTQLNVVLQYYNAVVIYNGVNYGFDAFGYFYEVKVTEPGPPDPIGKKWCLGVDIQPAFRDSSNNTYYNKQIIVTEKIPSLQRGQLTYN